MEASALSDLLFANSELQALQNNATATEYLNELLKLPLTALTAEPASLSQQSHQVDTELSNLCFRSFPTLLQSYKSTKSLSTAFNHLEHELAAFVESSASLNIACRSFESNTKHTMLDRSNISSVLGQLDSVGDLLDLPRLVSTCVGAGYWSEALDLSQRAKDLTRLSETEGNQKAQGIMRRVEEHVEAEMVSLKMRVLEQLRNKSLKLPGAVRAINLLRRLSSSLDADADEPRFQIILLASRWDCLHFQLDALYASSDLHSDDDRLRLIRRTIEIWREVIGDAAGMYAELFLLHATTPQAKRPLNGFLHLALDKLLQLLRTHIPHVHSGSSLSTILTQITYCSNAFATKFGFEFRLVVNEIIRQHMLDLVLDKWKAGVEALKKSLVGKTQPLQQLFLAPESLHRVLSVPIPDSSRNSFSHQPPSQLSLFPPLARFLNAVASALNELRLLPGTAVTLHPILSQELKSIVDEAGKTVLALIEASLPQPLPSGQEEDEQDNRAQKRQLASTICAWTARVCLPWCMRALLEAAKDAGATDLSLSSIDLPNQERFEAILSSLQNT